MNYAKLAFTDSIKMLQEKYGSRKAYEKMEQAVEKSGLSKREQLLIETRDSFYVSSIGENGYPYIQHRGGPKGFLKVLDDTTLGFLDFGGNKQYITTGNIEKNNKVSLILVDYPHQARLKIYAEAEVLDLDTNEELTEKLSLSDYTYKPERIMLFHIEAFDWNCPQHITPRYTVDELKEAGLFSE